MEQSPCLSLSMLVHCFCLLLWYKIYSFQFFESLILPRFTAQVQTEKRQVACALAEQQEVAVQLEPRICANLPKCVLRYVSVVLMDGPRASQGLCSPCQQRPLLPHKNASSILSGSHSPYIMAPTHFITIKGLTCRRYVK